MTYNQVKVLRDKFDKLNERIKKHMESATSYENTDLYWTQKKSDLLTDMLTYDMASLGPIKFEVHTLNKANRLWEQYYER